MEFYLIRHGDPDYEHDTLTTYGHRQAELLGKRLEKENIDYLYSSPLGRAQATSAPLARLTGKTVKILPWSQEVGIPCYIPSPDYLEQENLDLGKLFYTREKYKEWPFAICEERVSTGIDCLFGVHGYSKFGDKYKVVSHSDEKIALFCHGNLGIFVISYLMNLPMNVAASHLVLYTTSVTKFVFEEKDGFAIPKIQYFNERMHLGDNPDPNVDAIPQV